MVNKKNINSTSPHRGRGLLDDNDKKSFFRYISIFLLVLLTFSFIPVNISATDLPSHNDESEVQNISSQQVSEIENVISEIELDSTDNHITNEENLSIDNDIFFESAGPSSHTKITNSNDVTKVSLGTSFSEQHSTTFHATEATVIQWWELEKSNLKEAVNVDLNQGTNDETSYIYILNKNQPTPRNYISNFIPSEDLNGKIGVWFYNVGTIDGKYIDICTTISWLEGTQNIRPAPAYTTKNHSQVPAALGWGFAGGSYNVSYELYTSDSTNTLEEETPLSMDFNITFEDIDDQQYITMEAQPGKLNRIVSLNNSTLYHFKEDGIHWVYSNAWDDMNLDAKQSVRFEFTNTHSWNTIYGTGKRDNEMPDTAWNRKESWLNYQGAMFFTGRAFGPYDIPTPQKFVSDSDEINVKHNTADKEEQITYAITQYVPQEKNAYFYSSFSFEDILPEHVEYVSSKVLTDGDNDVSSLFDFSLSKSDDRDFIKITAKNTTSTSFYGKTYKFIINANLKNGAESDIRNTGKTTITRNNVPTEKDSDVVITDILPSYQITTEVINGTIGSSIFDIPQGANETINYSPYQGYVLKSIEVDGTPIDDISLFYSSYSFLNISANHHIKVVYIPLFNENNISKSVLNEHGANINEKYVDKNSTLLYEIHFTNHSAGSVSISIVDPISSELSEVTPLDNGVFEDGVIKWNLEVDPHETVSVRFKAKAANNGSVIKNKAISTLMYRDEYVEEEYSLETNEVVNYTGFELTINKLVSGNAGNRKKEFDFIVSLETKEPFDLTKFGGIDNNDGTYTFKLRHKDSIKISDIPVGTNYTVIENDYSQDGYTTLVNGSESMISSGVLTENIVINFENQKNIPVPTGISTVSLSLIPIVSLFTVFSLRRRKESTN